MTGNTSCTSINLVMGLLKKWNSSRKY